MCADKIITPAYVFDIDALCARATRLKQAFGKRFGLCYAVKANPFFTKELAALCDCLEVCSTGEYRICERCGVPPEKTVISGVHKEKTDISHMVARCGDKALYTAESVAHWDLLVAVAKEHGVRLPVILRISSGNQFGMDKATAESLIARRCKELDAVGLQYYSGTQKKLARMQKEIAELLEFAARLKSVYGFACRRIEYGPGLPVAYFENETLNESETIDGIKRAFAGAPTDAELIIESGRAIAAGCGEYITRVVEVKRTDGIDYAITDGGINHLNYYGQTLAMKIPHIRRDNAGVGTSPWTVCGSLCTSADVLVRGWNTAKLRVGETLAFCNAGAYSVTEGIYLFLSRDMPRVYKRKNGVLSLVRDVLRTDNINSGS